MNTNMVGRIDKAVGLMNEAKSIMKSVLYFYDDKPIIDENEELIGDINDCIQSLETAIQQAGELYE